MFHRDFQIAQYRKYKYFFVMISLMLNHTDRSMIELATIWWSDYSVKQIQTEYTVIHILRHADETSKQIQDDYTRDQIQADYTEIYIQAVYTMIHIQSENFVIPIPQDYMVIHI